MRWAIALLVGFVIGVVIGPLFVVAAKWLM